MRRGGSIISQGVLENGKLKAALRQVKPGILILIAVFEKKRGVERRSL